MIGPLWRIVAIRVVLFALLAAVLQVGIVFADYYWNDEELARLLVEQETGILASGVTSQGTTTFHMPAERQDLYGEAGYYARVRTEAGAVLFSACDDACAAHFLPASIRAPDFWTRLLAPGKPLSVAGGATFENGQTPIVVEFATLGDPEGLLWDVLRHEMLDHMIVPMTLLLVFVMGGTIASIITVLRPVRAAAETARSIDPLDAHAALPTANMPTEIAQLTSAVNGAFSRIGDLIRSQKLLTSAIAHEVRTPLAIIKLELENIDHPRARKAEADLDELNEFIGQLTALARLEAIEASEFSTVSNSTLAEEAVTQIAPWVFAKKDFIALEVQGSASVHVSANLMRDALRNLIENAVRHTPPGTTITVSSLADGQIRVEDNGGLVPPTSRPQSNQGSLGIGLAVVERVIALNRGRLVVDRHPDGMRASLELPVAPPPA
ncbi:sensor histidine kinase [Devosia pacifica]|uniref:histidine kinase n=1 Tax=Devosia pacifica TaxID=1335967 RepID=A0A918S4Z9_9HYPH|nr:ATP-binding protein [Devosia pacifica]GHA21617.1 sensor histidine kinase [Devosia pacifica]